MLCYYDIYKNTAFLKSFDLNIITTGKYYIGNARNIQYNYKLNLTSMRY